MKFVPYPVSGLRGKDVKVKIIIDYALNGQRTKTGHKSSPRMYWKKTNQQNP